MAATILKAGEAAIIGYNGGSSDGTGRPATTDKISFVLLTAIGSGTTIYFTDRTWTPTAGNSTLNAGSFSNSGTDGTYAYTTNVDLAAGTVVTITQAQLSAAGVDFEHVAGEAIYVYQGTSANAPTNFLFALEGGDGNTTFNASLTNTGLVAGVTAVSVPYDSGAYSGPTTHAGAFLFNGTPLINSVADSTNWSGDDQDGQNALEAQVQTGPWLVAPRIDIWGAAAGGGGAIVKTSGDQTVAGGADDYNHAELYNGLLSGGVSVFWSLRDMTFDTVEGKFFVVDSDISGGHNRILQGNIADLLGNPGNVPNLTVLYSDTGTTVASRLDNLEVDVANNIIYFTHGDQLLKIGFDTANQTGTVLFRANVSAATSPSGVGNPAGSTSNFFNDMAIDFTTGEIYLSSTRVGASAGGDVVSKNFIYQLVGLTTSSGTDAFMFNASNTGGARLLPFAQNDDAYNPIAGTSPNQVSSAADPYFLAKEFGTVDGLAIDPTNHVLYFSTGAILFDHDGDGTAPIYQPGIIGRYALTGNAAGNITVVHTQPGGQGTGLYGDLEIDVAGGKWYVTDYTGTGANNEDSHLYQGDLGATNGTRTQFSQQIGNIEGLSLVGEYINHAPTITGTSVGGTVTEASNAPASGATNTVSLFSAVALDDIDTSTTNELSGAVIRIATDFQSGATHQDSLRINGLTSGTTGGLSFAYNATTGAMIISGQGSVAQYKAAIELVTFGTSGDNPTNYGYAPTRTIAVAVSDGLSVSDEITTTVNVTGINDAPVNTLGAQAAGTEDVLVTAVTGLSVADVDADPSSTAQKLQVTLSVDIGTLTIRTDVAGGIVAGDIVAGANGSGTITILATQNAINATLATVSATVALNGLTLTNVANFNGGSTLTITTSDQGANGTDPGLTGSAGSEADIDTRVITITAVNDAPTVTSLTAVAAATILEDQPTAGELVSALFGGRFSDATDQQQSVGNPTGSIANTLAGIAVTGNGSSGATGQWQYFNGSSWIDIGGVSVGSAKLIAAGTAIRFNPVLDFNGTAPTLTVVLIDSSGAAIVNGSVVDVSTRGGTTRYSTDMLTLTETVTAVNDAPVNTVPSAKTFVEDSIGANGATPVNAIAGLAIADVDAGTGTVQVTLNVAHGALTLRTDVSGGVVAGEVTGNGSGSIVITATIAKINATFAATGAGGANGLTYTPTANFNGTDALTIVTSDLGLSGVDPGTTGTGASEIDTDTVTINVTAVNDAPVVVNGATQATATILEDQPSATGETVASLFGGHFSDAADAQSGTANGSSAATLAGIAVTVNGSSAGVGQWQYFNGTTWVDIGASSTTVAQAITAGTAIRFSPAANYNGAAPTLTAVLIESGGAPFFNGDDLNVTTTGGATRYSTGSVSLSGVVTAVNDAPLFAAAGAQPSYTENAAPVQIASGVSLSDVDNANFNGGTLTVAITAGAVAGDGLSLPASGNVTVDQGTGAVTVGGTQIGTVTALSGGSATVTFNANATPAAVVALTQAVGFLSTSDNPTNAARTITFTLVDGSGTANGGLDTASFARTVSVTAVDDLPVAIADSGATPENVVLTGSLLTNDTDVDGGPKVVASVNGVAGNVGTQVTLASGAKLTVQADGSYSYDPNGKFDYLLAAGGSTGGQSSATDSFTYALNGGSSTTVTITINGVSGAGDQIRGSTGNDSINGTAGNDYFYINQGGSDTVHTNGGSDGIFVGTALDSSDRIVGTAGPGTDSQVIIQGNYTATLTGPVLTNIQTLAIQPGSDARWGDSTGALYSYSITLGDDQNVAAGATLTVNGNILRVGEDLYFNGAAETDGAFRFFSGSGNDTLIGGGQADQIYGRMGADTLTGNGGDDVFFYRSAAESTAASRDTITDFTAGDRIDLSYFDANTVNAAGTNDAFTFIGSAAFAGGGAAGAGQLRAVNTGGANWLIEGDIDGNGVADFSLIVVTTGGHAMVATDFVL